MKLGMTFLVLAGICFIVYCSIINGIYGFLPAASFIFFVLGMITWGTSIK